MNCFKPNIFNANSIFLHIIILSILLLRVSFCEDSNSNVTSTSTPATPSTSRSSPASTSLSPSPSSTTISTQTTINPMTSAPTSITTITPKKEYVKPFFCFCDHKMNVCDMNCCCDSDCSSKQKQIFTECDDYETIAYIASMSNVKQRSCFREDFIYRNNTPYSITRKSGNLFCLVTDNFKQEQVLVAPAKLKSLQMKASFHWSSIVSLDIKKLEVAMAGYKYKSLLLTVLQLEGQNETEFLVNYFQLPSNIHGKSCTGSEPIKFLQDTEAICEKELPTSSSTEFQSACEQWPSFNPNTYFDPNISIVGSIDLARNENKLINFTFTICQSKPHVEKGVATKEQLLCAEADAFNNIPVPKYESGRCRNVLEYAGVTIIHHGAEGIKNVLVEIHLEEVQVPEKNSYSNVYVRQHFQVRFVWDDEYRKLEGNETEGPAQDLNLPELPKSTGYSRNPGYLIGKEVIMGTLVSSQERMSEVFKLIKSNGSLIPLEDGAEDGSESSPRIALLSNEKYLTIINAGSCHRNNRRPVLFGMNMQASCAISLGSYKYCEDLRTDLGSILLGKNPTNFTNKFIASFGNPFILQKLDEWIPIVILNNPFSSSPNSVSLISNGCTNGLITSLQIQVVYSYVGPVILPQAQIHAVIYQFGPPINLKALNDNHQTTNELTLSTAVEFHDITANPVHKIAQWPTISVQLPADFFYPFSSSTTIHNQKIYFVLIYLAVIIVAVY